jgi:hypothetical protein
MRSCIPRAFLLWGLRRQIFSTSLPRSDREHHLEFFETLKKSTYYIIATSLFVMSFVDVSVLCLSSVDVLMGDLALSSFYWSGLHRRKRDSNSEDLEEV